MLEAPDPAAHRYDLEMMAELSSATASNYSRILDGRPPGRRRIRLDYFRLRRLRRRVPPDDPQIGA
jgi:excinuclease UvrABC helicase subunit UvrB